MKPEEFIVFIVDDDARMRESLSDLLESLGWRNIALGSAGEYLSYPRPDLPACLILDVELPDINGLDFQKQISHGDHPPIVFLTGHGDGERQEGPGVRQCVAGRNRGADRRQYRRRRLQIEASDVI